MISTLLAGISLKAFMVGSIAAKRRRGGGPGPLSFSSTNWMPGTAASGTIIGATAGSTITAAGLPAGVTINGGARTWAYDGTGTASSGSFTLTEAPLVGSSRTSSISYAIGVVAPPPPPPPPPPAYLNPPALSGIPREGEQASLFGGEWSTAPNLYRFKVYRDSGSGPVLVNTVTQAGVEYAFNWASADVGTAPSATVETSTDSGSTWSAATPLLINFTFPSDLITPATIPNLTLTRTSASGVLPMTFDVTGEVYSSYQFEIRVQNAALTVEKYFGYKPVAEADLVSPFNMDLSGATDPAPSPPLPAELATDVTSIRLVSSDWIDTNDLSTPVGVASNWASISPTDVALLSDNFNDNSLGAEWTIAPFYRSGVTTTGVGVVNQNGRLEISLPASTSGLRGNGIKSAVAETMNGNPKFVAILNGATQAGQEFGLSAGPDDANHYAFLISDNVAYPCKVSGGTFSIINGGADNFAWSSASHKWLQIHWDVATDHVIFETAPNTASDPPSSGDWVTHFSYARDPAIDLTNSLFGMFADSYASVSTPTLIIFDGFDTAT